MILAKNARCTINWTFKLKRLGKGEEKTKKEEKGKKNIYLGRDVWQR